MQSSETLPSANVTYRPKLIGWFFLVFYVIMLFGLTTFALPLIYLLVRQSMPVATTSPLFWAAFALHFCMCTFMLAYMGNSLDFRVSFSRDHIQIRRIFGLQTIPVLDITRIRYFRGGKGWRYIGIFQEERCSVLTNSLYSEKDFDSLTRSMASLQRGGSPSIEAEEPNGSGVLGKRSFRFTNLPAYAATCVTVYVAMFLAAKFL